MISVVMPSYLGDYKRAARDRENKIRRAVESVLSQTIPVELVVISDGCQKTVDLLNKHYEGRFNGYMIGKQTIWSGVPRNMGIEKAKGEIICYLDTDDWIEKDHCEKIVNNFKGDWVWFNDKIWHSGWIQRKCDVNKRGLCGTSNIAHKKIALWPPKGGYAHDWAFIENLKRTSKDFHYIGDGGYLVGHVPGRYDI